MVKPRRVSLVEKKPEEYCSPSGMTTAAGSKSLCTYSKANLRPTVKSMNDAPELSNPDNSELLKTSSEDSTIQQKPVPLQVATRSSGRLAKRPRKDISPPLSPPKKSLLVKETKTSTPEGKTRRHWELWSGEDKDTFFEALSEFGKDFDAIQNVFAQKHKKKGGPESLIKTKDQIRHFYYRNWHKISKYLKDTSDVNKEVLELYGLINYGHLRKRIGSKLNARNGQKLNELIHRGAALVKVKGKNQRLRTPLCRALKKLNNLEDTKEDEKVKEQVPGRFLLELYPHNNAAWARVQAISQNPRLRIKVKTDCRISTIFDFLNRKWKNDRLRMKDSLKEVEEEIQELRLLPPAHCKLMPFEVKPAPTPARVDVALINYKVNVKRSGCNSSPTQNKRTQKTSANKAELIDDTMTSNDDTSAVTSSVTTDAADNADTQTDVDTSLDDSCADSVDSTSAKLPDMPDVRESKTGGGDAGDQTFAVQTNKINDCVEKLRNGITKDTAEDVTVGQLYLMMGDPQKMVLQYEWTDVVKTLDIVSCNQRLTNMLRRLIHIATTEFIDLNKSRPQPTPLEPSSPPYSASPCSVCGSRRGNDDTPPGVKSAKVGRSPAGRQLKRNIGVAKTSAKGDNTLGSAAAAIQVSDEGRLCQTDARLAMGDPNSCTNDGVFKMPTLMPARVQKQTDIFFNRCNKRMSRNVRRPLVVQRTLLPKTQVPTRQIMTLTLLPDVPQLAQKGSFMPIVSQPLAVPATSHPTGHLQPGNMPSIAKILPFHVSTGSGDGMNCGDILRRAVSQANIPTVSDDFSTSTSVSLAMSLSLTSMSAGKNVICGKDSLLSSSSCSDGRQLGGLGHGATGPQPSHLFNGSASSLQHAKDNIRMDVSPTSDLCETSGRLLDLVHSTDFNVLLESDEKSACRETGTSPPNDKAILSLEQSPTKTGVPSLGPEEQWLNGEDFSLSSFLCESPMKRARPVGTVSSTISQLSCCENSRDSVIGKLDVDSTLQCMMNESSLDYASKFADLAAQIAAQDSQTSHSDTHTSSEEKLSLQTTSVAATTDFAGMP